MTRPAGYGAPGYATCERPNMAEALGWFSSLVLLLTIGKQVHKQWRDGASQGVSRWLFIGQTTASAGFLGYSLLLRNWVFVVTNALMLLSALVGLAIVLYHRHRRAGEEQAR